MWFDSVRFWFDSMLVWSDLIRSEPIRCYEIWFSLIRFDSGQLNVIWFVARWLSSRLEAIFIWSGSIQICHSRSILAWLHLFRVDLILLELSVIDSTQASSMWLDLVWFMLSRVDSILLTMVHFNAMLFDSYWFHVVAFHSTFVSLIVVHSSWLDSFRSAVVWFNVLRVELRSFDVIWFNVVCFDLIRRGSMCLESRCHFMWSDSICFALAQYD